MHAMENERKFVKVLEERMEMINFTYIYIFGNKEINIPLEND